MQEIKAPDPCAEDAFTELVNAYQTSLLRMCYLNLRDLGLAEDAVQETFIKAYRAMTSFRQESSIKTWLMRIAINTCRDMQRGSWFKRVDRNVTLDQLAEESSAFPSEAVTVNLEIAKLPVKLREVLLSGYENRRCRACPEHFSIFRIRQAEACEGKAAARIEGGVF